jgi:hypothetical protein
MFRKVAAALVAVIMFTAPVLAQSAAPVSNVPAQSIKVKASGHAGEDQEAHSEKNHRRPVSDAHQACTTFCEIFAHRSGFDQVGASRGSLQLNRPELL